MLLHAFQPAGASVTVSATTTSAATTFSMANARSLRVAVKAGGDVVYVAWGLAATLPSNTITATTTDVAVLPGTTVVFAKGYADTVAVRADATTATVYLTVGSGGI